MNDSVPLDNFVVGSRSRSRSRSRSQSDGSRSRSRSQSDGSRSQSDSVVDDPRVARKKRKRRLKMFRKQYVRFRTTQLFQIVIVAGITAYSGSDAPSCCSESPPGSSVWLWGLMVTVGVAWCTCVFEFRSSRIAKLSHKRNRSRQRRGEDIDDDQGGICSCFSPGRRSVWPFCQFVFGSILSTVSTWMCAFVLWVAAPTLTVPKIVWLADLMIGVGALFVLVLAIVALSRYQYLDGWPWGYCQLTTASSFVLLEAAMLVYLIYGAATGYLILFSDVCLFSEACNDLQQW